MAVKHKVVDYEERPLNGSTDCMTVLLRVLDKIRNEPQFMPQGPDLIRLCEAIVHGLGQLSVPCEASAIAAFVKDVRTVQDFLSNVCQNDPHREKLIFGILRQLYIDISDVRFKPGAAMSVVLQLVDASFLPSAVAMILEVCQNDLSLEQALMTLCHWMTYWTKTPNLGECVLVFIQGLESQKRYEILINVTMNIIEKFFNLLMLPAYRSAVGPVVIYMLTHMQGSPEAFHKIIPHIPHMATYLNQENSESGRSYLQNIINISKALSEHFPGYELYGQLEPVYKLCPPTLNYCTYLLCNSWTEDKSLLVQQRSENDKVGLNNLGNTCYMNSVLQALFMTKLFSNNVLAQEHRWPLISKLQGLFALLQFSKRTSLSPNDILHLARPPGFQPGHQHDSSEFLGYLLDMLHEQEKSVLASMSSKGDAKLSPCVDSLALVGGGDSPPPTLVQRAFGGRAETVYRCHACGAESRRADNFRDLQLSFPSDFIEGQSVQSLLEYYLKPEKLCGENQYHCERCKGLADADRQFYVIQPPPRLILVIKHFHYNSALQQRIKLLHQVQYNASVKLSGLNYELYAAVIHCGASVDSGHYFTYAREGSTWIKFNDSHVSNCSDSDLSNLRPPETPYILFYRRHDCAEPEPIPRADLPVSVETILKLELAEFEAERVNNLQRMTKKDDQPPPGCGGGGSFLPNDRFVC